MTAVQSNKTYKPTPEHTTSTLWNVSRLRRLVITIVAVAGMVSVFARPALAAPPEANDDTYSVISGQSLSISGPGVLSNDTDVDGDALTAVLLGDVSNGLLVLNSDGGFTYDADPGFVGVDSFTYQANDGQSLSSLATVDIDVNEDLPGGQAVTLPVVADAFTKDTVPGSNRGSRSVLRVNGFANQRTFLDFDLTGLGGTSVESATLRVSINAVEIEGSATVHKLLGPWTETGLTHNNQPAFDSPPAAAFFITAADTGTEFSVDVTDLVRDWVQNPPAEYGLVLVSGAASIIIWSREGGFPASLDVIPGGSP